MDDIFQEDKLDIKLPFFLKKKVLTKSQVMIKSNAMKIVAEFRKKLRESGEENHSIDENLLKQKSKTHSEMWA